MIWKWILFIFLQLFALAIWAFFLRKKEQNIDWRLVLSYFIFGSWFGMYGELFLYQLIDFFFHEPIWEYRILPVHKGVTSSFGPIMWGLSAVYICFHKNYPLFPRKGGRLRIFVAEAGYLLILELLFNFLAYGLFDNYFFYYFVPDLAHWSSFTNLPFWWVGYQVIVKYGNHMNRQEKLNLTLAIILLVVVYSYQ